MSIEKQRIEEIIKIYENEMIDNYQDEVDFYGIEESFKLFMDRIKKEKFIEKTVIEFFEKYNHLNHLYLSEFPDVAEHNEKYEHFETISKLYGFIQDRITGNFSGARFLNKRIVEGALNLKIYESSFRKKRKFTMDDIINIEKFPIDISKNLEAMEDNIGISFFENANDILNYASLPLFRKIKNISKNLRNFADAVTVKYPLIKMISKKRIKGKYVYWINIKDPWDFATVLHNRPKNLTKNFDYISTIAESLSLFQEMGRKKYLKESVKDKDVYHFMRYLWQEKRRYGSIKFGEIEFTVQPPGIYMKEDNKVPIEYAIPTKYALRKIGWVT